ncbi:MAG: helix-turn-helix transcriptional regulator [Saprospiraceae bacterium]|nr:helix-turn-helix transcriptional regulator [Lewinellaceae bacterium]
MQKDYSFAEKLEKQLNGRIRSLTREAVEREFYFNQLCGCFVLVDVRAREVVCSHRADMSLGLSKISMRDLNDLVFNEFYRIQVRCYGRAVQEMLIVKGFEHLANGTRYELTYPTRIPYKNYTGRKEFVLLRRVSEPIILQHEDGQNAFAAIDTYDIAGSHVGDYYHIKPMIKKNGLVLVRETEEMIARAAPFIYKNLPYTERQLDILEQLARGADSAAIAQAFNIAPFTVETHRRNIRNMFKEDFPDLSDMAIAKKLRDMGIFL